MLSKRQRILQAAIAGIILVSAVSASADVTMTGDVVDDGTTLRVGDTGTGGLDIDGGSSLNRSYTYLGYSDSSEGTATLTGVGSSWDAGRIVAGYFGSGALTIAAGAEFRASSADLGWQQGSVGTVTVTGTGSKATISSNLYIGRVGSGTLMIEAGGQVSNIHSYLGYELGSSGTADVRGIGSVWTNTGDLYCWGGRGSQSGVASLTVADGGLVTARVLYASMGDLLGNGTIQAKGAVLDADLLFDAVHGLKQTLPFGAGGSLTLNQGATAELGVGYRGSGSLRIADGLNVACRSAYLGYYVNSTGTATVTGANSKWTTSGPLSIGRYGSGSLVIEAGGQVSSTEGYLGYNSNSTGTATVTGADSKWTTSDTLHIGNFGTGTLVIEAGGLVNSSGAILGYRTSSVGTVMVTGPNSKWTNGGYHIGSSGSGALTIEAGAQVTSTTTTLGYAVNSTGTATITGAGSIWANTGTLNVGRDGSGTLIIQDGAQVTNTTGYLGDNANSTGTASVTGAGSTWANSGDLYVGREGAGSLTVSDGGLLTAKTLFASLTDVHGNGTIQVTGAVIDADLEFDSVHGLTQTLPFGDGGSLNLNQNATGALGVGYRVNASLRIADGMNVAAAGGYLGYHAGCTGSATVTGTNSKWTNSGGLYVGYSGSGVLMIDAGAQVSNAWGYLGHNAGSLGSVTVTGTNSAWVNNGDLYVGREGAGSVTVSDGGLVTARTLYASLTDLHGNGIIQITGAVIDADLVLDSTHGLSQTLPFGAGGTLNLNQSANRDLGVGYKGSASLRIADGLTVAAYGGYLGYHAGSTGTGTVTGANSKWTNVLNLNVGYLGSGALIIDAGGHVISNYGFLGVSAGSSGTATVTGPGSKWTNNHHLYVGNDGSGAMSVEAGGQVSNTVGYLGLTAGSSGTAAVTGTGSAWTNSSYLKVGNSGSGAMTVEAGGQVSNTIGYLGANAGSSGTATVTGTGSAWTNSSTLYVGHSSTGMLSIEAGGQVTNTTGYLGYYAVSTGTATVTGPGSTWTNNGNLFVGVNGTATLTINDSGKVIVTGTTTVGPLGTINISGGTLESAGGIVNNGTINHAVGSQLVAQQLTNDSLNSLNIYGSAEVQTILGVGATNVGNGTDPASLAAGTIRQAKLTINDNASVTLATGGELPLRLGTAGLSIAPAGKLDLTDNDLILTGMSAAAVRGLLVTGFNAGDWAGNGLTSSSAQNDPNFYTALGYADNAELGYASFSGQSVSGTDILVKYTFYGDTDLNGVVDSDDLTNWIDGFNSVGSPVWLYGDFDYSGVVDSDDLTLWVDGFINTVGPLSATVQAEFNAALASGLATGDFSALQAVAGSIVPEPASLSLLALGALALRRRRR